MAAPSPRKRFQEEATCTVCLDYFEDPVILDCGHNFCRACIAKCWGESPRNASCPQCRESVQPTDLKPNRQLARVIEVAKELNVLLRQEAGGWGVCERHQEPLKLFCKDDEAPICLVCDRSKEHREHDVVPVEEAAQEYKDQICSSLESMRKEREKTLAYKEDTEKQKQALLEQTGTAKQKAVVEFRQMHQFLEEQEKRLLAQMEELEREIAARSEEHLARLSEELSSLEGTILGMEKKCQQPAAQLLQEVRNALQCSEKKLFENPVPFHPGLKQRIGGCLENLSFLEGTLKEFKVKLESRLQLQKETKHLSYTSDFSVAKLTSNAFIFKGALEPQANQKEPRWKTIPLLPVDRDRRWTQDEILGVGSLLQSQRKRIVPRRSQHHRIL
ncbi:zinc finger protein RFP-like isoform X1 [Hemicordylus capensis]|uniref:zinc finger protein RFP-like isoform X1 n=1 Tax=Hemicordylus capensis TaxID=884348 RepID=UPI0023046532|nr:zinc finger protein RFP-like isoform X1 [Hemicordylus capensis]